jgi:quercetin dioxygenase-like cupin family protein
MERVPTPPTSKAPPENFTGDAWIDQIIRGVPPSRMRVAKVRFQTVHVTEGHGRIQARGGEILEMGPGDTVYTPPGEWHWHGATPEHFMTHLAMFEAPDDGGPETDWGDLVTDAEYGGV